MQFNGIDILVSSTSPYYLVSEFKAGAHADGISYLGGKACGTSSLSGCHEPLEALALEARVAEGAFVLDKRPTEDKGVSLVFSGPMIKADLPPATVNNGWGEDKVTYTDVSDAIERGKIRGMSYVSVDVYVEMWKRAGAKVGRKVNGQIVWEQ